MKVKVLLPDLYRVLTGKRKKQMAWAYLKRYYPAYEPLSKQTELETKNTLLCNINFEKQRELSKAYQERLKVKQKTKSNRKR